MHVLRCLHAQSANLCQRFFCLQEALIIIAASNTHTGKITARTCPEKRNQRNQQTAIAYHSPYMTIHIFKVRTLHFNLLGGARPLKILMTFYEYTCITITTLTYMQQTWRLGKRSGFAHLSWADWSGRTQPPASRVGGLLHCFAEVHCFKRNC